MQFLIVTGMSGSGKITALKMLEDMGFFCADNLPLPLVDKFASLALGSAQEYKRVALGLDVRSIHSRDDIQNLLHTMDAAALSFQILFLECADSTLVKRYKETRRSHPLSREGKVEDGILKERIVLEPLKERADYIVDTSRLLTRELRQELERLLIKEQAHANLFLSVMSFGFKYGIPADADLVFDVRFLPNPYYVEELRALTGEDERVRAYVCRDGCADEFKKKWFDLIDFLLPNYAAEGKTSLVIAVGCTGGKHRSVTMANDLYRYLAEKNRFGVRVEHRDVFFK